MDLIVPRGQTPCPSNQAARRTETCANWSTNDRRVDDCTRRKLYAARRNLALHVVGKLGGNQSLTVLATGQICRLILIE